MQPISTLAYLHDVLRFMGRAPKRVALWRARRRSSPLWAVITISIMMLTLTPVLTILFIAFAPSGIFLSDPSAPVESIWPHLVATVLPNALYQTVMLTIGAGFVTLLVGTGTAWLITMYRFPGREILDRLMVLPLAIPTYIVAYCYVEFFDFTGPIQTIIRYMTGASLARDYWFPEIRSLGGAILVISSVLYPYVYLAARASFVTQSVCVLEVARTLGRTPFGAFWSVALPLARPALAAGVALVIMECLNDIGAVQYLGVQTLTSSIYDTWQQRSNLAGAAQLATTLLGFVVLMLVIERIARGGARHHHTTGRYRSIPFHDLTGSKGIVAFIICLLPFIFGFVIPFFILIRHAFVFSEESFELGFISAAWNSISLAALAAGVAVTLALTLAYARRVSENVITLVSVRLSGLGYAIPGTVLALGLLFPLAAIDNGLDAMLRSIFGVSSGLLISGSLFALVLAYSIRFLAVGLGTTEAGLERISPNLDAVSRTLGETALSTLKRVHMPLLMPALGAAVLLVFVDAMKELPATLLLRPFNFETLATHVFGLAQNEQFEEAALGALTIVLVGLVPVLFLHKAVTSGRPGG